MAARRAILGAALGVVAEARIARTLPWSRVAKLLASCDCVALRPADSRRPTVDGPGASHSPGFGGRVGAGGRPSFAPAAAAPDGPGILRLDLSQEPDAKSFAPFIQLLDAAGAEIARITVDVQPGRSG